MVNSSPFGDLHGVHAGCAHSSDTCTAVNGISLGDSGILAHTMSHLVQQPSGEWECTIASRLAALSGRICDTFAGRSLPQEEFISSQPEQLHNSAAVTRVKAVMQARCEGQDVVNDKVTILTLNALSLAGQLEEAGSDNHQPVDGLHKTGPPPLCQAGQLVFLSKKLQHEAVDLACIQESRLKLPDDFSVGDYWVLQNAATRGVGGLLILVSKGHNNKILRHRAVGSRVLHATIRCKGILVFVLAAHAPIQKSPAHVHEEFARHLCSALACKPQGAILLGGADLNTRMGKLPDGISISGHLASVCPRRAYHAKGLIDCLQEHRVSLVNTFLNTAHDLGDAANSADSNTCPSSENENLTQAQHDDIATWLHPRSKKTFQIDFILACDSSMSSCVSCYALPWSYMDLLSGSDHRAVLASFMVRSPKTKHPPQPTRRHQSVEHLKDFKQSMARRMQEFAPSTSHTPMQVTHLLQEMATETLKETKPKKQQRRSEWIADTTWTEMTHLNSLRKIVRNYRHHANRVSVHLPVTLLHVPGAADDVDYPLKIMHEDISACTLDRMQSYIKVYTRLVRKHLREDKRKWVDQQCGQSQLHFNRREAFEAFQLVKQISRTKPKRSGVALSLEDGTVTMEEEQL
eukprot:3020328-Amphidinium_carterae.1